MAIRFSESQLGKHMGNRGGLKSCANPPSHVRRDTQSAFGTPIRKLKPAVERVRRRAPDVRAALRVSIRRLLSPPGLLRLPLVVLSAEGRCLSPRPAKLKVSSYQAQSRGLHLTGQQHGGPSPGRQARSSPCLTGPAEQAGSAAQSAYGTTQRLVCL